MILSESYRNLLKGLAKIQEEAGISLFFVGGYVRDLLLGLPLADKDIDILVEGEAPAIARAAQGVFGGQLKIFDTFGTAKLLMPTSVQGVEEVDFASCRTEIYEHPGALPKVSFSKLPDDLKRRDFSINAMAVKIEDILNATSLESIAVIDNFSGKEDLKGRIIRVLHERSFIDDPTRLYRAVRYRLRINGTLEHRTKKLFGDAVQGGALKTISTFRQFTEIRKMCEEPNGDEGLEELYSLGLLRTLEGYGIHPEKLFTKLPAAVNRYQEFLKGIFQSLSSEEANGLARELNISKKEIASLRTGIL